MKITLIWQPARADIGRRSDDPGDDFVYLASLAPRAEDQFEWLEVTEVFTTVPASQIEGAMRAWNGVPNKRPVNFEEFREGLRLGRPSRTEQRSAADQVIEKVKGKLERTSYQDLRERYGYGTLVVGMPLWFAVPPDDPFRAENAIDDFMTRTSLGLEEFRRRVLQRRDCPFRKIIVIWDTAPQALREWHRERSAQYKSMANASLENRLGVSLLGVLSGDLEKAISETETPESESPSISFDVHVEARKNASGTGPYPRLVEVFGEILRERNERPVERWKLLKSKLVRTRCKLLCFVRIHGINGLERWITQKLSVSHAWAIWATRRKAHRLYRESRLRGRVFGGRVRRVGVSLRGTRAHVGFSAGQPPARTDA